MVRPTGKSSNTQFDPISDEDLLILFDTLEEWEYHLAKLDPRGLRCDDEHFRP